MFIKLDTYEYPVSYAQLRERHPESSLPAFMGAEDLAHLGYADVTPTESPAHDSATQGVREIAPLSTNGAWTQQWAVYELDTDTRRSIAKINRTQAVAAIVVTTQAGNKFDGDETSQTRMARAIIALQSTGTPTTTWVLHDNSAIQASAAELSEALALAGAAQGALWVLP